MIAIPTVKSARAGRAPCLASHAAATSHESGPGGSGRLAAASGFDAGASGVDVPGVEVAGSVGVGVGDAASDGAATGGASGVGADAGGDAASGGDVGAASGDGLSASSVTR